jgi:hypothetical protein
MKTVKCVVMTCARTANGSRFYCKAHLMRKNRGGNLDAPIRPRGEGERTKAIRECIEICGADPYALASDVARCLRELVERK